jgi:PAS domain-containing protein
MSQLNELFTCTTDAVFGTNKRMEVVFWNKSCEELFDVKKDQAIGRPCYEVVCGKDLMGNDFCNDGCQIIKRHDPSSPNRSWDMVIRRKL